MIQRPFVVLLLGFLLVLSGGCESSQEPDAGAEGAETSAMARAERRFEFRYEVVVPARPRARSLRIWVPLPMRDPGVQEVGEPVVEASSETRITTDAIHGNRMLYSEVRGSSRPVTISWTANVTRRLDEGQGRLPRRPVHLASYRLIPLDGEARELARSLGVDDPAGPVHRRARRIYDDVLGGMDYDKSVPGYGRGDFRRAITVCKGNCTDFHARFIGVGRAAGIPVRFTMGIPMKPEPRGSYKSYHCWAHYHDGTRWTPVDISEADKVAASDAERADWFFGHLDPDRIALSFGRDLVLEPPQAGAPLDHFVFPYAEADGVPVPMDASMWNFSYRDL